MTYFDKFLVGQNTCYDHFDINILAWHLTSLWLFYKFCPIYFVHFVGNLAKYSIV